MSQKRGMAGQVGHAKKAKNEDDEDTPTFEDHLAGLDDEDWGDDAPTTKPPNTPPSGGGDNGSCKGNPSASNSSLCGGLNWVCSGSSFY